LAVNASQEIRNIVDLVKNGLFETQIMKMWFQKQLMQPDSFLNEFWFCVIKRSNKNV
jgi:hypothetical protein